MSNQPNRTRTEQISCRATEPEKQRWADACAVSGLSTIQLMMRLLDDRLVIIPGLKETMTELRYHGINLNQAVKYAHQYAPEIEPELQAATSACFGEYTKLDAFLKQIYNAKEEKTCLL